MASALAAWTASATLHPQRGSQAGSALGDSDTEIHTPPWLDHRAATPRKLFVTSERWCGEHLCDGDRRHREPQVPGRMRVEEGPKSLRVFSMTFE
jgi:hypothetical protein